MAKKTKLHTEPFQSVPLSRTKRFAFYDKLNVRAIRVNFRRCHLDIEMRWSLVLRLIGILVFISACKSCCQPAPVQKSNKRILFVVSLDGFRPEYLRRNITVFLEQFYRNGIIGKMTNVFPTKTFVNHFSIATGAFTGYIGRFSAL